MDEIFIPKNSKKKKLNKSPRNRKNQSKIKLHEIKSTNGNIGRLSLTLPDKISGDRLRTNSRNQGTLPHRNIAILIGTMGGKLLKRGRKVKKNPIQKS